MDGVRRMGYTCVLLRESSDVGRSESIRLLLENEDVDVNCQNNLGLTPRSQQSLRERPSERCVDIEWTFKIMPETIRSSRKTAFGCIVHIVTRWWLLSMASPITVVSLSLVRLRLSNEEGNYRAYCIILSNVEKSKWVRACASRFGLC